MKPETIIALLFLGTIAGTVIGYFINKFKLKYIIKNAIKRIGKQKLKVYGVFGDLSPNHSQQKTTHEIPVTDTL